MTDGLMPPLPGATELTTDTGVVLWVYPMTLADQQALRQAARGEIDEPRPEDYAHVIADEDALFPGQKTSGAKTEAYEMAKAQFEAAVNTWVTERFYTGFVDSPMGKDNLVALYAPTIERKRLVVPMPADAWAATLKHVILQTARDVSEVLKAGQALLPLTGGEVADGIRIFRLPDGRETIRRLPNGRTKTPKPEPETQASAV